MNNEAITRAKNIKLLIIDVDGVLTDGRLFIGNDHEELKAFNVRDGLGLRLIQKTGIELAIITGKESKIVAYRAKELGIEHVYQAAPNKVPAFEDLLNKLKLRPEQAAYIGDDLPDLPLLKRVGLAVVVADAESYIVSHAHLQTRKKGGKGAVRELCDFIMASQGTLSSIQESFLKDGSLLHSPQEAG